MRLLFALGALLAVGCYDTPFEEPADDAAPQAATTTLAQLRKVHTGTTFVITGDVVVAGRVTSCDCERNFYRSLCIEQGGTGLELRIGLDRLCNDFPVGSSVTLRLKGLALGMSYGMLQAGLSPTPGSGYVTDGIGSKPALDQHLTRNGTALQPLSPAVKRIDELTPDLCGTLVHIDDLHFEPETVSDATWVGYKRFADDAGQVLFTFVRTYADFADHEVPLGRCSLRGILQYDDKGDGRYFLKISHEADCIQ